MEPREILEKEAVKKDVVVIGRVTIDLFANELNTPLKDVRTFSRYLGGCPANFAVGLARLGAKVGFISRVGNDGFGVFLREFLEKEGIDTTYVKTDPKFRTALAFVEVSPPDRFPVLYYRHPCADMQLSVNDLPWDYIQRAKFLFTSGTSLSESPAREAIYLALKYARDGGVLSIFDIDYRPCLWSEELVAWIYGKSALELTDIVIGNEGELYLVSGEKEIKKAAEKILEYGSRMVVAKLGARGSQVFTKKGSIFVPPFKVAILNTVGAGDGFAAGFCYGLLKGWTLEKCLEFGNAVGAIVVTKPSCSEAMPTLVEVEEFLKLQK